MRRTTAADIDQARAILHAERLRLATLPDAYELLLVGGSSVPGAVTKGDVDLHLRVAPGAFDRTVAALRDRYEVVHPEIWRASLATFAVPAPVPTGIAVTPTGSVHDLRFTRCWQLLAADPGLLHAYNTLKLDHAGDPARYEQRKSAFFDMLVRLWPDHRAGGRSAHPPG